jgi:hypothetical protein
MPGLGTAVAVRVRTRTGHGPWLIGSPDNSATPEFDGYMVLLHGNSEASIDFETGVVVIESATSPVTDLCAALD